MYTERTQKSRFRRKALFLVVILGVAALVGYYTYSQVGGNTFFGVSIDTNSDLEEGLIGHWTFDGRDMDFSSTTAEVRDRTGIGKGNMVGVASGDVIPGRIGQAIQFDSTANEYIQIENESAYDFGGFDPFTVAFWFKSGDLGQQWATFIGKGDSSWTISRNNTGNKLEFGTWDSIALDQLDGATDVNDNQWHHAVFTYDGTNEKTIYLDNKVDAFTNNGVGGTGIELNNFDVAIGENLEFTDSRYSGLMDDVRIYDRALSAEEIARLYELGATTHLNTTITTNDNLENGLVGHWTFDGEYTDWSSTTAEIQDRSPNGYKGNATSITSGSVRPGVVGQALSFGGSPQAVLVPSFSRTMLPVTIAGWFFVDTPITCAGALYSRGTSPHVSGMNIATCAGGSTTTVGYTWRNAANTFGWDSGVILPLHKWFHYTLVVESTKATVYVQSEDGLTSAVNAVTHLSSTINDLKIGEDENSATRHFIGLMDDIRIYERALSLNEVRRLYQLGATTHINTTVTTNDNLENELVGHWTFDGDGIDTSLTTGEILDRSGDSHNGNWINHATTTQPGAIGQAISFDGTNDHAVVPDFSYGPSFTIAFWFKVTDLVGSFYQYLFSHGAFDTANSVNIYFHEESEVNFPRLRTAFRDSNDASAQGDLDVGVNFEDGAWHQYALVVDGGGSEVFVDGTSRISAGRGGDSFNPTTNIFFGGRQDLNADRFFPGGVDDLRMYNRALSDVEVLRLYQLGK